MRLYLSSTPPDLNALRRELSRPDAGALATFEGWVRDHHNGRPVRELEYEAFAPLAEKEGRRILEEARERFGLLDVVGLHRIGRLPPGELAVWVGVVAAHRAAAFEGCRFVIDTLKARVPIWKKEHYADGTSVWVEPPAHPDPV
jgi:molybdopterin synthase catalytic subunit